MSFWHNPDTRHNPLPRHTLQAGKIRFFFNQDRVGLNSLPPIEKRKLHVPDKRIDGAMHCLNVHFINSSRI